MDAHKDYYALLGVQPAAEDIVVHAAYRALAQRYHPDRYAGSPDEATARMAAINEAHAVLSDPALRAEYDRLREQFLLGGTAAGAEHPVDIAASAAAEIEAFRPFAEKLGEFGYDEASIVAVLVSRGMRRPAAEYLARLASGAAARSARQDLLRGN